ncbi:MAG: hypothetical protein LKF42_09840 [Streptococcaceae bacterium]|jgi:predicted PP-loop superfamily ATPase|nr:hypothetical protein [Streptococcaceae bacterium]
MAYQIMAPQLIDTETSELLEFTPNNISELDNDVLERLVEDVRKLDKFKKVGEEELKKRLEDGKKFNKVSLGKPQMMTVIASDERLVKALINKYGYESILPLSLTQLKKKYGEAVEKDIEPWLVQKPKKPALKFD